MAPPTAKKKLHPAFPNVEEGADADGPARTARLSSDKFWLKGTTDPDDNDDSAQGAYGIDAMMWALGGRIMPSWFGPDTCSKCARGQRTALFIS
ncbi:hypothetical protein CCMA1212_000776 [Trichoderma ghanense]|uniref:Uncharacterized protein n=1 Tax=Trichoderma ghanense TaxID=65468 RepID=A0ABY2HIB6_9HYPO